MESSLLSLTTERLESLIGRFLESLIFENWPIKCMSGGNISNMILSFYRKKGNSAVSMCYNKDFNFVFIANDWRLLISNDDIVVPYDLHYYGILSPVQEQRHAKRTSWHSTISQTTSKGLDLDKLDYLNPNTSCYWLHISWQNRITAINSYAYFSWCETC